MRRDVRDDFNISSEIFKWLYKRCEEWLNISSEIFKESWDETHEMTTIFPVKYSSSHKTRFGRKRVSTYSWRDRGINPTGFDTRLLTVRDDFNISNEIFR